MVYLSTKLWGVSLVQVRAMTLNVQSLPITIKRNRIVGKPVVWYWRTDMGGKVQSKRLWNYFEVSIEGAVERLNMLGEFWMYSILSMPNSYTRDCAEEFSQRTSPLRKPFRTIPSTEELCCLGSLFRYVVCEDIVDLGFLGCSRILSKWRSRFTTYLSLVVFEIEESKDCVLVHSQAYTSEGILMVAEQLGLCGVWFCD